jgi:hypothetical protein
MCPEDERTVTSRLLGWAAEYRVMGGALQARLPRLMAPGMNETGIET